jgi:7,8-dihydropterin-6-yl-methyl-4-(beta-D-ribofuranosyl)aminobenzene 5'-phosphate synthase
MKIKKQIESYDLLSNYGGVKSLKILPVIDYETDNPEMKTECGVSYWIEADDNTFLMDVGFNAKKEHPSPLLHNMDNLGLSLSQIQFIFISHGHLDHIGGLKEQKQHSFSLSQGLVELDTIPVYTPVPLSASEYNPKPINKVIPEPKVIAPGIISIGAINRNLFFMGPTLENVLAINLKEKGIVLIIGCGHPSIQNIIDRTKMLFKEPIYGIIGGLHFPIGEDSKNRGFRTLQFLFSTENPLFNHLSKSDVHAAIQYIKKENPKVVSLSSHDSSSWSINQFKKAFQDNYVDLKVGKEIIM